MLGALAGGLLVASSLSAAPPILGFNYPVWSREGYASAAAADALQDLAATGAGWVALTPTLYQRDRRDSDPAAGPRTPSDDSLRAAIRAAKAAGLKVALKPHVDIEGGGVRALIEPRDPERWFAAYDARMLRYARLAREERVDLFVVGTELALLTLPPRGRDWRELIARVRAIYPGPLTYAANWEAAQAVTFWRELDYVGIDAYYPVPFARPALMRAGLEAWSLEAEAIARAAGKPLLLTEVGIASCRGAQRSPWGYGGGRADDRLQADYFRAVLDAFLPRRGFAGLLVWQWTERDAAPGDSSMSVRAKPALAVLSRAFRASRAPQPPPEPAHGPARERAAAVLSQAELLTR